MRIVFPTTEFVTENNYCGGLSNYLHKLAKKLKDDGHDVHIVVASDREETADCDGFTVHRVSVHTFCYRIVNRMRRANIIGSSVVSLVYTRLSTAWRINKRIKRINAAKKIDLIQYPSLAALALFRPKNIKALVRISNSTYLWKTAQGIYSFTYRVDYFMEKLAMKGLSTIIAPSSLLAAEFEKTLHKKVAVVPTFFEKKSAPTDHARVYRCSLKNKKYFLFAGQLSPHKGIDAIAEALEDIFKLDDDLFFAFAGMNHKFHNTKMMDTVRRKAGPYAGRVMYLGVLPHEELFPVVEHAIAVVLPSRVDNIPNMCLEAMSLKKIVVGTRGASFDEIIQDGLNGFLIDRDDPKQLFEKLKKVVSMSEDEKVLMGERAYDAIDSKFGENAYTALLDVYREILAR